MFQSIQDALSLGGIFLLPGLMTFSNSVLRGIARQDTESHVHSGVSNLDMQRHGLATWNNINDRDLADDQMAWLLAAGHRGESDCRLLEVALDAARRQ